MARTVRGTAAGDEPAAQADAPDADAPETIGHEATAHDTTVDDAGDDEGTREGGPGDDDADERDPNEPVPLRPRRRSGGAGAPALTRPVRAPGRAAREVLVPWADPTTGQARAPPAGSSAG